MRAHPDVYVVDPIILNQTPATQPFSSVMDRLGRLCHGPRNALCAASRGERIPADNLNHADRSRCIPGAAYRGSAGCPSQA